MLEQTQQSFLGSESSLLAVSMRLLLRLVAQPNKLRADSLTWD
jgi:hypothetical protein